MSKTVKPSRYQRDSDKMRQAIDWLETQGYSFSRPTEWQLKIGEINFYPDKGTIIRDRGRLPHPDRGLAALQKLLPRPTISLVTDDMDIVLRPADLE